MRKTIVSAALALASLGAGAMAVSAESISASETEQHPPSLHWHFEGPFGTYDRAAAQRGYQVYKEVCSACHSLSLLAYRNLMELGLTESQVKGLIEDIQVPDIGDDGSADRAAGAPVGQLQEAVPQRRSPRPPPTAARRRPTSASSIKAREDGPNYVHATPDRLRAVRKADARADQGIQRHQGRQLQQVLPGPQDRACRRRSPTTR